CVSRGKTLKFISKSLSFICKWGEKIVMITSSGSGATITYADKIVNQGINDLRNAIQALESSFAKNIEGDNKLEMVEGFNEIKQQYDELFAQYEALFLRNVESTKKSTDKLIETDKTVASDIRLLT